MTPEQFKALRTAEDNLTAVLCDPEGKCCISGSVSELRIIDDALDILRALAAEPAPEPLTDDEIIAEYCKIADGKEWAIGGLKDAMPFAHAVLKAQKEKQT